MASSSRGLLVSLRGALRGLLACPTDLVENLANVPVAVANAEDVFDDFTDASARPYRTAKAVVLGSFFQKLRQLLKLLGGQAWRPAGALLASKRFFAISRLGAAHPLAHGPGGDAERFGDVGLLPAFAKASKPAYGGLLCGLAAGGLLPRARVDWLVELPGLHPRRVNVNPANV
jgi:hypothetical protein